jgi:(1->4)-alpha-D-glucan 1-alpha-D-glucosylmutase
VSPVVTAGPDSRWRAVYRLQLRPGFTFDDAAAQLDYLAALGVSHVYCSPILDAGSDHGYDVVDHTQVRAALGGRAGFERLVTAARGLGLGVLVDIVPNHMAIGGGTAGNRWWWDVLEHGRASPYATAFDIVWDEMPDGRLLVPQLDDHLHRVVADGRLRAVRTDGGALQLAFGDQRFPLSPASTADLLARAAGRAGDAALADLAARLAAVPDEADSRAEIDELGGAARAHVGNSPVTAGVLDEVLADVSGDPAALTDLALAQHYRLARWRIANREIGYRRFFDVTDLVGLRVDVPWVFDATHALTLELVEAGLIDGLRVDHPDGLRDPQAYLERLRARVGEAPVWVEKILAPGEALRDPWPADGTTGYDFLDLVGRLAVDTDGALELREWFVAETGAPSALVDAARAAKREVIRGLLAADVDRLAALAARTLDGAGWDVSVREMRAMLIELVANLPVYRTYVRAGHPPDPVDVELLRTAADEIAGARRELERDVLDVLCDALLQPTSAEGWELVERFQQLSSAAAAKGVEDTTFYRWAPLASLCEVGSHPDATGVGAEDFHAAIAGTAAWPHRLLDTSTHDTKRSEDVRARISVLSEVPDRWRDAVARIRAVAPWPGAGGDPAIELSALQSVVGAWPIDGDRLTAYLVKAAREAKRRTNWLDPDEAYEAELARWGRALVEDEACRSAIAAFVDEIRGPGRVNSLAQVLLKLTVPGVAGLYQGTELWDGSLVDPDNRRPVDFDARRRLLASLADAGPGVAEAARAGADDGGLKLWVISRALRIRRERPASLDGAAPYTPLRPAGVAADHAIAFLRGDDVAVVVPRLVVGLARAGGWRDTAVPLPPGRWVDALGDARVRQGEVRLTDALDPLPVALLVREATT